MLEALFIAGVDDITVVGLTQWDRGQTVQITCPDLPELFEVHFANRKRKKAIVTTATAAGGVATITLPDELLREPHELITWLYYTSATDGETVKTIRFPVDRRKKPEDYIVDLPQSQKTDAEILIEKKLSDYVEKELGAVTMAQESATKAAQSASAAEASANRAEVFVSNGPKIGENGNWWVYNTASEQYEDTGVYSGGSAPYIGQNGNWFVGSKDTGVSATGPAGDAAVTKENIETALGYKPAADTDYVTPEMFGAVGDGVTDDTEAFQNALNSGKRVVAYKSYYVSSISVQNTDLYIRGTVVGQVRLNNKALVTGGTIQAYDDRPCVVVESVTGYGEMNSILEKCDLKPTTTGIGISAESNESPLFEFTIRDINISSSDIAIRLISNKWFTKSSFQNIFCHSPRVCIDYTNNTDSRGNLSDLVFENVYAQHYQGKPEYFVHVSNGNVRSTFSNSFVYDGIGKYQFGLDGTSAETQFVLLGDHNVNPYSDKFSSVGNLSNFNIVGRPNLYSEAMYHTPKANAIPPVFLYGSSAYTTYPIPTANGVGDRFMGVYSRLGTNMGSAAYGKISGLSWYNGRIVALRGTVDAPDDVQYCEAQTSYSGYVTTSDTLPATVRDGASVFCSDLNMHLTYMTGKWYKPDGTALSSPTEEQKARARESIGAATVAEVIAALPVYGGESE